LSDAGALNLLLLGDKISEDGLNSDADMHQFTNEETKRKNFLKDSKGKIRVFMLRRAAAREAHQKNGTVYPHKNGYIVQLHEENQNELYPISERPIFVNENNGQTSSGWSNSSQTLTEGRRITFSEVRASRADAGTRTNTSADTGTSASIGEACCSACEAEAPAKTKITIDQIRQRQKDKEVKESIDKGTEPGVSMAGSGESIGRDMGEKIRNKDGKASQVTEDLEEMAGANMNTREIHQHLKKLGWKASRTTGGHDVYTHEKASHHISVPRHKDLKAPLKLGILKASKQLTELTGDETTASIGAQAEDELKKKGISLTSFKKRNFI
jgi:predicted RNA binding protein YcfA (HicA-like mRNA interferase family)